jgi:N-acetylmuramoyl-L-alanine amidase
MSEKIYVSPSDQGRNEYGAGNTVEEAQCEKIATALVDALRRCGFESMTDLLADMYERVAQSNAWGAILHVCLHTNAHDGKVGGTRLFCYELGGDGHKACKAVMATLAPITPGTSDAITARPELYEVRETTATCVYVEVDFHDNPEIALWIISHTTEIAEAIAQGICNYFGKEYTAPEEKSAEKLPAPSDLEERVAELEKAVATLNTTVEVLTKTVGERYHTFGDVRADQENARFYLPTLKLLIDQGHLRGKDGDGDGLILDLSEDAVRLLVVLDRAGVFGE